MIRASAGPSVRVTIEVGGHTVTLEVAPSRNMPDKYDELSIWTDRQATGPGWTTDLAKERREEAMTAAKRQESA